MASFIIHLAATNEYLKRNNIKNKEDFILGVLSVDLAEDKIKSHYTKTTDKSDLLKFLEGKVSLEDYLQENSVNTDYDRGVLFHLITDYEFYTNFFDIDKLSVIDYPTFKQYIYHDYLSVDAKVKDKYNVVLPEVIKKYDIPSSGEKCYLIDENKLDDFIIRLANTNLDDYINNKDNDYKTI